MNIFFSPLWEPPCVSLLPPCQTLFPLSDLIMFDSIHSSPMWYPQFLPFAPPPRSSFFPDRFVFSTLKFLFFFQFDHFFSWKRSSGSSPSHLGARRRRLEVPRFIMGELSLYELSGIDFFFFCDLLIFACSPSVRPLKRLRRFLPFVHEAQGGSTSLSS